jgi:hypothetical protein
MSAKSVSVHDSSESRTLLSGLARSLRQKKACNWRTESAEDGGEAGGDATAIISSLNVLTREKLYRVLAWQII